MSFLIGMAIGYSLPSAYLSTTHYGIIETGKKLREESKKQLEQAGLLWGILFTIILALGTLVIILLKPTIEEK